MATGKYKSPIGQNQSSLDSAARSYYIPIPSAIFAKILSDIYPTETFIVNFKVLKNIYVRC